MKSLLKNFGVFFIIFLVIASLFYNLAGSGGKPESAGIRTLIEQINNEEVDGITVAGSILRVKLKSGQEQTVKKETAETLSTLLKNFGVAPEKMAKINIEVREESGLNFWLSTLLPIILPLLLIGLFIYFMARQIQGANGRALMFGQSQAREISNQNQNKKKQITFKFGYRMTVKSQGITHYFAICIHLKVAYPSKCRDILILRSDRFFESFYFKICRFFSQS